MPTKPLRVANIEHDLAVYRVEEYADHYRVKVATQIDAVVQKEGRIITGQGARLYAGRIRKVIEQYAREKENACEICNGTRKLLVTTREPKTERGQIVQVFVDCIHCSKVESEASE